MADGPRRVGELRVKIELPNSIPENYRPKLEAIAHKCPVHKSLSSEIKIPVTYSYV